MEELTTMATYREFKNTLDTEVNRVADGFVKIGYLLKVARDTDILQQSGYKTVAEFAKSEYGFDKDMVSRYIAINDRYSINGYGDHLATLYQGRGFAKLAEMLTLSDEVIETINPQLTRREIQQIKDEIKDENKISELEVQMEKQDNAQTKLETTLAKALHQYGKDNPHDYTALWKAINKTVDIEREELIEKIMDAIAPSGTMTILVRISGIGRMIISINGKENNITMVNARSNEKEEYTWNQMILVLKELCISESTAKEAWQQLYEEEFPEEPKEKEEQKKTEVAPVQQKIEKEKTKKKETLKISTPRETKKADKVDKQPQEQEEGEEYEIQKQESTQEQNKEEEQKRSEPERITDVEVIIDNGNIIRELREEAWKKVKTINESLGEENYMKLIKAAEDIKELAEKIIKNIVERTNE